MILNIPTLFAVNVLCSVIFFIATLIAGYVEPKRSFWRSWTFCFGFGTFSLICSTVGFAYSQFAALQIGNFFLFPTFYFYVEGMARLANKSVSRTFLYIGTLLAAGAAFYSFTEQQSQYTDTLNQITVVVSCTFCIRLLLTSPLQEQTSRYGFLFSAVLHSSISAFHLIYLIFSPWNEIDDGIHASILTTHLLVGIIFTVLNGTFLFAFVHERIARDNREEALRDPLTNAFNRRAFDQFLKLLLARKDPEPFALFQFDLDHFKSVNDKYGHPAGDQVLIEFVRLLKSMTPKPRFVARLGGEEFAVIASNTTREQTERTAERIRQSLQDMSVELGTGQKINVTTSIGVYFGLSDRPYSELLSAVDQSLYSAKKSGRNQTVMTDCSQVG